MSSGLVGDPGTPRSPEVQCDRPKPCPDVVTAARTAASAMRMRGRWLGVVPRRARTASASITTVRPQSATVSTVVSTREALDD